MSAQVTILQLPAAGAITGAEAVPIVQNGVTVQTTTAALAGSPVQTQTFLTVNQEPTLNNSRYVGATNGLVITDGGAQGLFNISTTGALLSLVNSGTGFQVKTSSTAITGRSIAVSGAGLAITDGDGIAGNPTIALDGQVLNLANANLNGFVVLTSAGAITSTTLTGTASQIDITNPNGVGNPVFSIANDPILPGTGSMTVPTGTSVQQPFGSDGQFRFNSTTQTFDGYTFGAWRQFSLSGGVTQINTGTGLTGGPITTTGTISIDNTAVTTGTYGDSANVAQFTVNPQGQLTFAGNVAISPSAIGAVTVVNGTANEITSTGTTTVTLSLPAALTFTGKTVTNGTFNMAAATVGADTVTTNVATQTLTNKTISGATNTLSNIGNVSLTNSSVTYNGVNVALGASGTITAASPNALTIGTGLTGTSYNGATAVTIAIDSTVVTLTGIQTLTNKTIDGANNTLTNIGNASLTNSVITIGSTSVSLGGTITTFAGTSISGSTNTLSNIGNASLTNSAITINGSSVSLGASVTVTATASNALTIGAGLTGTSYDGSTPITIAIDSTVATLTGTQTLTNKTLTAPVISTIVNTGTLTLPVSTDTLVGRATTDTLTNKTISGASNTLSNIGNASLTNSSVTVGTTAIALGASSLTLGGLTSVEVTQDPVSALQLATKQYVDSVAEGLNIHEACAAATPGTLASITGGIVTYNNGAAGVGATLTLSVALTVLDGYTLLNGDRVLVKDEATQANNGIYTWATGGTVLTRATDFDTAAEMAGGDFTFVTNGTLYANTGWVQTEPVTVVGTSPVNFIQFSGAGTYTAGTGLTLTGTVFSISNTAVTAGAYGSATQVGTFTVNAQGQLTLAGNTTVTPAVSSITGLGTGVGTALAVNVGSAGAFVTFDGALGTPSSGTLTNATGLSLTTGVTGTLPIANGGTNGTATPTANGVVYGTGTTIAYTAAGTNGQVLTANTGGAPTWSTPSTGGTVTSVAATVPSFLSIAGSPITTSGTLAITLSGTALPVANGGTGLTTTPANGELDIGNGSGFTRTTLSAGTGITITNASGSITIDATASGTVTSVAQSFTGGIISVGGSPITTSGTLALTVAGTSGGVPYFTSTSTWATSALLAANDLMVGGGAGIAPSTVTTGTGVVTALGVNIGTAGAFVVNGGALGTPNSGTVTNLTGTASININGTVGATTPTTGAFTTVAATTVTATTGIFGGTF